MLIIVKYNHVLEMPQPVDDKGMGHLLYDNESDGPLFLCGKMILVPLFIVDENDK
jgi:hypothetical protein